MKYFILSLVFIVGSGCAFSSERSINSSCTERVLESVFSFNINVESIEHYAQKNIDSKTLRLEKKMELKAAFLSKTGAVDYFQLLCTKEGATVKEVRLIDMKLHLVTILYIKEDGWKIAEIVINSNTEAVKDYVKDQKR